MARRLLGPHNTLPCVLTVVSSRHTVVCRTAQEVENDVFFLPVNILTVWRAQEARLKPNLLQSCPPDRGVYIPNLKEITQAISEIRVAKVSFFFFSSSSFRTLAKIAIKCKRVLRSP